MQLVVRAVDPGDPIDPEGEARREARLEDWGSSVVLLHAPGETPLVDITNLAMRDLGSLALLEGPDDEWLAPAACVPLYQTLWGRDALTSAWQAAILDRGEMLDDVLTCSVVCRARASILRAMRSRGESSTRRRPIRSRDSARAPSHVTTPISPARSSI